MSGSLCSTPFCSDTKKWYKYLENSNCTTKKSRASDRSYTDKSVSFSFLSLILIPSLGLALRRRP